MPNRLPPGPYKTVQIGENGETAPWYIIPFDKNGTCTAPLTRKALVESIQGQAYTDVFLFSHGWNNDWATASERYENFIGGFLKMRATYGLKVSRPYKPLLIGVFWPSTALVMPWERAPKFAGATPTADDSDREAWRREIEELALDVDEGDRDAFYALAQSPNLNQDDAKRLAEIIAKAAKRFDQADVEVATTNDSPSSQELLARAKRIPGAPDKTVKPGEFGLAAGTTAGPQAAFSLSDLDPRKLVRVATVLQMKDRGARVGAQGAAPLLRDILAADQNTRVHLIGHSYGAIVLLSAVCYPADKPLPAQVASMLLLQPAVSRWCFARDVDGQGFPGGYRPALERVRAPIFTTFTKRDAPLTKFFHLAVRRDKDLGQVQIASAGLPEAPSTYAALGGFGPAGLSDDELQVLNINPPATRFALRAPLPKVCALNGDAVIMGHGDISLPSTWWALFQQVEPG
jgi:hypothetical protein